MNVLIIYAHPSPSSFNAAILEHVQKGIGETNHSVTLLDLYKEQFDPVLVFNEEKKDGIYYMKKRRSDIEI